MLPSVNLVGPRVAYGLFQAKAFGVHDSQLQSVGHDVLGAVRGQKQRVEAGVRCGQLLRVRAVALQNTPANRVSDLQEKACSRGMYMCIPDVDCCDRS